MFEKDEWFHSDRQETVRIKDLKLKSIGSLTWLKRITARGESKRSGFLKLFNQLNQRIFKTTPGVIASENVPLT